MVSRCCWRVTGGRYNCSVGRSAPHLPPLQSLHMAQLLLVLLAGLAGSGGQEVCQLQDCGLDWEEEQPAKQLLSWLAQQRSRHRVVFCRQEEEEAELEPAATPLYRLGRCREMEHSTRYQWGGKLDQEGRFKGKGELLLLREGGDPLQGAVVSPFGDWCLQDNTFLSILSISGNFKAGYPSGEVRIRQTNDGETVGRTVRGVLHGKVSLLVIFRRAELHPLMSRLSPAAEAR